MLGQEDAVRRYRGLDSLRGIAACTVVLSHYAYLAPLLFLRHTPMRFILGGHEAVILFFVLSGFVLTIQISGRKPFNYGAFVVQRFLRIYPPYLCAFLLASACYALADSHSTTWAGDWFNGAWRPQLPADVIWGHLALVLPFHTASLVPVFWTLVYEMRISLLLPLIVFFVNRTAAAAIAPAAVALSVLTWLIMAADAQSLIFPAVAGAWAPTIHYSAIFLAGVALAKYRDVICVYLAERKYSLPTLFIGILLFFAGSVVGFTLHSLRGDFLYDWTVAIGAFTIIAAVISDAKITKTLTHPALTYLGDISYSLYLFHATVLLTVVHLLGNMLPHAATLLIALGLTIPIAHVSHRAIELPTIAFGRDVARKMRGRDARRTAAAVEA